MYKVVKVSTTGEFSIVEGETLQDILGGWIEIVRPCRGLPKKYVMIVDEEGLLKGLPKNEFGSKLYGGTIAGTALFMREDYTEDGMDLISLSQEEAETFIAAYAPKVEEPKERTVSVGKTYRHFKGGIYGVWAIAKSTADGPAGVEPDTMVVYIGSDGQLWVRELSDFLSEVDKAKYPGATQRYRFEEI